MKSLYAAAVLFLASVVSAQTAIWGVTLGKPTNLPTCLREDRAGVAAKSCQGEPKDYLEDGYTSIDLTLVVGDKIWGVDAKEIDGNLEQMSLEMALICDEFFAGLKEKFGQPTTSAKRTHNTGLGIPVTVTTFVWNRKRGDQVSFSIPYPKTDECQFVASTLKWRSRKTKKVKF